MLNETFLEMSYCGKNFGKNKIEMLPFLEEVVPNFRNLGLLVQNRKTHISLLLLIFLCSVKPF